MERVTVGKEFLVYVGGGANLVPPGAKGNGDSLPSIAIYNGSSFLAGKIQSKEQNAGMIRITFRITNTAQEAASFKIGDVAMVMDSKRFDEFEAVGNDYILCMMSGEDHKKVKEIAVQVPSKETRRFTIIFPLPGPDSKQGTLLLGKSVSAPFDIASAPGKPRGQ